MDDTERQNITRRILAVLNHEKRRCTYAALAGLLGIGNQDAGRYLGSPRREASWVVRKDTGLPTGYSPRDRDKDLLSGPEPIACPHVLQRLLEETEQHPAFHTICACSWSKWRPFPDPQSGGYLIAPFGPGVYELHNRDTDAWVLFGSSKNVACRMSSLLPVPVGAGTRNNAPKRNYVFDHLCHIDYRTKPCTTSDEARKEEQRLKAHAHHYIFPT
ncbi:MAG: hypothetical protein OXC72_15370 [Roseovarius sp.]|nr:hypothetical protein [Roseovarius sp.]